MATKLLAVCCLNGAAAAWSSGHVGTTRGAGAATRADAATPAECFARCQAGERCAAWTFRSSGCGATAGCALFATATPPTAAVEHGEQCHATSGSKRAAAGLVPLTYQPLSLGQVTPTGWLDRQLRVMANGLTGHLNGFWKDVQVRTMMLLLRLLLRLLLWSLLRLLLLLVLTSLLQNSVWVGGTDDKSGAGHERGPYWLNGLVPLGALLNNTAEPAKGLKPEVNLNKQVQQWIYYIIEHQTADGWLGPDDGFGGKGNTYWTAWNTVASLLQFADAHKGTPTAAMCEKAVLRYIQCVYGRMQKVPMTTWSQNRWQDWVYLIHWTMDQAPQGQEQMLHDAAELTKKQSWDWDCYYKQTGGKGCNGIKFPEHNVPKWTMWDHGVNNAMGTKSGAVWYRQSHNESDAKISDLKRKMQMTYHGQPHGMWAADECFGGRDLNRGIELCAVVEQMYSLEFIFRVGGDVSMLDWAERISYNAHPATMSQDMWQHQYLQQANELTAETTPAHVWQADGPDSTIFGVEPNFGCCTANLQQGWPKFANNVFLKPSTGGVAIGFLAPAKAKLDDGSTVEIVTNYPFADSLAISADFRTAQELHIRIPGWADKAALTDAATNAEIAAKNGTMVVVKCKAGKTSLSLALNPAVRVETGWGRTQASTPKGLERRSGYDLFEGALAAGSDLSELNGNFTFSQAVERCNGSERCSAFTFKNNGSAIVGNASKHPLPTFFKTRFTMNSDSKWRSWCKSFGASVAPTNAAAVLRGPLLYAARLHEDWAAIKTWKPFGNQDFNVTTTTPWQHVLLLDEADPSKTLSFVQSGSPEAQPFNSTAWPVTIRAKAKKLPKWTYDAAAEAASEPPQSPVDCSASGCGADVVEVELVPYGATELRVAGIPWTKKI